MSNTENTHNTEANDMNKNKNQMIRKYNDHAREIANGFITDWTTQNIESARAGNIPAEPTNDAWDMFNEECYPKYNTDAFLAEWTDARSFLLS